MTDVAVALAVALVVVVVLAAAAVWLVWTRLTHLAAGSGHAHSRDASIEHHLAGLGRELGRVGELVATLQKERAEQFGRLVAGLDEHARQASALVSTTQSLREALSSPRSRGQWGERMADDVLRLAGLAEGVNYRKQKATSAGTVPDFTFLLPGGRELHMDVKFPIDNYLRHLNAGTDSEQAAAAAAFVKDVRARVRELGGRGYIEAGVTLGYVLLFIPNEAVYGFVHERDPALVDDALRQRVVLCSPFTLFAVLAVIRQAVEQFALERTSDEIVACLEAFTAQWEKFSEALDGLGKRLEGVGRAYEELAGPRRRQLQRTLDRVDAKVASTPEAEGPDRTGDPPLRAVAGG